MFHIHFNCTQHLLLRRNDLGGLAIEINRLSDHLSGSQVGHLAIGCGLWNEAVDNKVCWLARMEAAAAQGNQDSKTSKRYHNQRIEDV
jgi:hypothetical protein